MASKNPDRQDPLVSIICRTMGRPELGDALASAIGQTHPRIEVILVDAAALGEAAYQKACADFTVTLALPGAPLSRPAAANFGLERAQGGYLLFLDEDDWLAPDHVECLLAYLTSQDRIRAAYSSTRKTDQTGRIELDTFALPFDRLLLMKDNFIPIHAMLFARELLDQGCRFDESFEIYEDWDFWLQLSEHTDFHHLDRCSAFYRSGGASQTADLDDYLERFESGHALGKARAGIYNKWLKRWNGDQLNQLLGSGERAWDQSIRHIGELDGEIERLEQVNQIFEQRVEKLSRALERLGRELGEARDAHLRMESRLNAMIHSLRVANVNLQNEAQELRENLGAVLTSRSWKLTRPYRSAGEWLKSLRAGPAAKPVSEFADGAVEEAGPPAREAAEGGDFKAAFDRQATEALDRFLTGTESLRIPGADESALSILLVFYNQAHLSLQCLHALLEHADVPFELIIVDNASKDRTAQLLDRLKNVKLIRNSENLGFVEAVNQGAALADSEYLLLLNNDAFIEPGALSAALAALRNDSSAGAVGGRIRLLDGKLQEAGNIIWRDGSCIGYGRGADPEDSAFRFRRPVDYCSGAFLMFRAAQFRELGGFDEDFAPAYYEESDFCLRLREQGLQIIYEPRVQLRHYEFASTGGMKAAAALQEKHRELFREKHAQTLAGQLEADPARIVHARTANDFPNLLLIDDAVPHASLGSGYPRCRHILTLLSRMPLNVSFYPLHFPADHWEEVYKTLPENIEVLLNHGRSGLANLLRDRAGMYRHVMVSRPTNMAFFNEVLKSLPEESRDFRIIYDAEAVFAARDILWRELQGEQIDAGEKKRILADELELVGKASAVITVSGAEAALFRDHGQSHVVVLGHGLELAPAPAAFGDRQGLLFVGALKDEHSPNVDSLLWFACNVLPAIEREVPDIELQVAGNTGAPSLISIERANIHLKGRLDSLDELYNNCRVFIAPTRFAAGIPHKVHEAAAHGVPAVVTPLLARQLGWRHEQEVLVGEDPESFARQCLRLYRDADLWERLSNASRAAVERDCSEESFRETLHQLFATDT